MAKRWIDYDGPTVGYMIDQGHARPLAEFQAQFITRSAVEASRSAVEA